MQRKLGHEVPKRVRVRLHTSAQKRDVWSSLCKAGLHRIPAVAQLMMIIDFLYLKSLDGLVG